MSSHSCSQCSRSQQYGRWNTGTTNLVPAFVIIPTRDCADAFIAILPHSFPLFTVSSAAIFFLHLVLAGSLQILAMMEGMNMESILDTAQ